MISPSKIPIIFQKRERERVPQLSPVVHQTRLHKKNIDNFVSFGLQIQPPLQREGTPFCFVLFIE